MRVEKRGAVEIAKRLRQTVGQIFRYGIVTGRAKRDPAVDLKGALKASGRQAHHKAMPREDLPDFCGGCPPMTAQREHDWRYAWQCLPSCAQRSFGPRDGTNRP